MEVVQVLQEEAIAHKAQVSQNQSLILIQAVAVLLQTKEALILLPLKLPIRKLKRLSNT